MSDPRSALETSHRVGKRKAENGRRWSFRFLFVAASIASLFGSTLAVVALTSAPAAAAPPTFKLSNQDIFDTSYNQSYTSVLTVTDTNAGLTAPVIQSSVPGTGFTLSNCVVTQGTGATCTVTAAPGPSNGDDSGVPGANGTSNTVTFAETDGTGTTTSVQTMIIYPPPVCVASGTNPWTGVAGTAGAQIAPNDATYTDSSGGSTLAEECNAGASGPASALLTGVPTGGGTIFMGSNPIDAAGGTALTIMAGPGFNWTGGVGSGEADVDTGTAGLSKQAWGSNTETVTDVDVNQSCSPSCLVTTGGSLPADFPADTGASGITVSGTDIPTGDTVTSGAGTGDLDLTTPPTNTVGGTGETITFAWASTTSPPPSGFETASSTVATEAAFKSSGDPANTCPPQQSLVDAGMPFCLEEFETTGSGPSAAQVAVAYNGAGGTQTFPTAQAPTVALPSSGAIGQDITATDAPGACPSTIGGLGAGSGNLFSATNNCWYARAGDSTPVTATVDGIPATVTPNPTTTTVSNVTVTSGSEVTTVTPPNAFPTNLSGDLVTDSAGDIPADTTVTGQGNGTTGNYATVELSLSNDATASSAGNDTLTFTNNADVSEGDYSVDNVASTTSQDAADSTITLVHENSGDTVTTCASSGSPDANCTGTSAGTAATPYDLVGDSVSGTGIPVGTEVTGMSPATGAGPGSPTTLTLSNNVLAADVGNLETLTFYQAILNPPQLNAQIEIPNGTPTGPQTVNVCEATTPNNGNDWEFGVQWLSPTGSLQYVSGNSGPTEICSTGTVDVSLASSSTLDTAANSTVALDEPNSDGAVVTGSGSAGPPTGTVTFYTCGENVDPCTSANWTQLGNPVNLTPGAGNTSSANSVLFTNTSAGNWCFAAVYSGDGNYTGSSDQSSDGCYTVGLATSSTVSSPGSPTAVLDGTNSDNAVVTGNDYDASPPAPTGTVTFYTCPVNVDPCTSANWTQLGNPVNVDPGGANTSTASSTSFTNNSAGTWCFAAVYSGDGNYTGSSDQGSDECYTVGLTASTTTSSPASPTAALDGTNSDDAVVFGTGDTAPTGTVTFYTCPENVDPCTSANWTQLGNPVNVTTGSDTSTADSVSFTNTSTGNWCFAAVYSGDGNYSSSSDQGSDECYTVAQESSTTVSTPASNTAALDGPNKDSVVVTGNDYDASPPAPGGTVTFYTCPVNVSPCTSANWTQLGNPVSVTQGDENTSGASSALFTNDAAGNWCFAAVYSGDGNYTGSSDQSSDGCYAVSQVSTSTLSAPLNSTITVGQSNIDQTTVTGNDYDASPPAPTGTVTFYQCGPTASPEPCASGTQIGGPVNLTASGANTATANSGTFRPSAEGYWCFHAVYSGDGNYFDSSDNSSVDECFYVTGPLVVMTTSLPNGTKGVSYSAQLNAAGGNPPYKWSHTEAWPRGLTLNHTTGAISGTPGRAGSYTFTIKVKDSSHPKEHTSKSFTITIAS
jgi:large repetitive protein